MTPTGDLAARAEIADVIALYCHAIDRRRWELLDDCFHADATYRFGPIDGTWRQFVEAARAMLTPLRCSHHQLGQTMLTIAGALASAETYMTAYHRVPGDAPADAAFPGTGEEQDAIIAGRYIDRFERREGLWRIARREGIVDWRRTTAAADGGYLAQAPTQSAAAVGTEHELRTMA